MNAFSAITEEYDRLNEKDEMKSNDDGALMSSSKIECWACGEIGHRFEKCLNYKKKNEFLGKRRGGDPGRGKHKWRGRREKHCNICGYNNHNTHEHGKRKHHRRNQYKAYDHHDSDYESDSEGALIAIANLFQGEDEFLFSTVDTTELIMDSGATKHMVNEKEGFVNLKARQNEFIKVGNNHLKECSLIQN